jgi:ABC-type sugar transport system ATPase subunit
MNIQPPDENYEVLSLSGGNQQKVLFGKWLSPNPEVLIVDEPTRGVDVGTKALIHQRLRQMAEKGIAIIMISSELPEILGLSDRVAVFRSGQLVAMLDNGQNQLQQDDIMEYALNR